MQFRIAVVAVLLAGRALAQSDVTSLDQVTVFAGQFPTGETPGAVLNTLEIVTTPGAHADINRALQTLPGVQLPDEGNALFVRGGDSFETVTLVNGLRYPNPTRLASPAGNFAGTIDPFEAQRIDFESGGFGARFGNALSGVVDLETLGMPAAHTLTIGGGLGAISLGAEQQINDHLGIRLSGTRTDTAPIFALNGSARDYPEAPNGHDFSGSVVWEYRPGGEVRLYSVEQAQSLGIDVNEPYLQGVYHESTLNRLTTLSWKDQLGSLTSELNVGGGSLDRNETPAAGVDIDTYSRALQYSGRMLYQASDRLEFSAGGDGAEEHADLTKVIGASGAFPGGTFANALSGRREGAFAQVDALIAPRLRAVMGGRLDHSSLTERTTVDPRVALSWEPRRQVSFSVAGGVYHQIPETYNFFGNAGRLVLPAMRASQVIAGLQLGKGDRLARIEIYSKDYRDLVGLDRMYRPVGGERGTAQGGDLILKSNLPAAVSGRLTYSYVDTRRTDPDSGVRAPAPFDVTHTASLLLDRAFGMWITGAALRYASGRPVTPIVGGTPDGQGGFSPVYGPAFSERLPSFFRLDFSTSRYWRLNKHESLVVYAQITNALNHANIYDYQYSTNFAQRQPTPSLFKRSLYFGFSLQFD